MSERIGDLQVEKQEQWERRGLEEDQGQLLDQNEDEFLRAWSDTLKPAYNNYETAKAAVKESRELCDRNNIDIPSWAREYREDQGEVLSIPDDKFEKASNEERTSITQQLDHVMK
jgi:hypothetical protein